MAKEVKPIYSREWLLERLAVVKASIEHHARRSSPAYRQLLEKRLADLRAKLNELIEKERELIDQLANLDDKAEFLTVGYYQAERLLIEEFLQRNVEPDVSPANLAKDMLLQLAKERASG